VFPMLLILALLGLLVAVRRRDEDVVGHVPASGRRVRSIVAIRSRRVVATASAGVTVRLKNELPTVLPAHTGDLPVPPNVPSFPRSNRVSMHPSLLNYDSRNPMERRSVTTSARPWRQERRRSTRGTHSQASRTER
jgi:hypothetical protein